MLNNIDPPFRRREACKNCSSKPCQWFLRNYNEPGSFMLVSKSDFISIPCGGSMLAKATNDEPEVLTDAVANESAVHLPLKIISITWAHKDTARKKDSPDTVIEVDSNEFSAELENSIEGSGADFLLYGKVSGKEIPLQETHTRCKNQKAIAEWTVDLSKVDIKDPSLQFELEASDKRSKRCKIPVNKQSENRNLRRVPFYTY
jgi:hypothetical protein